MNIEEIITNPSRDEYIDQYQSNFRNAESVAKIRNLLLKKSASPSEIEYGLFDQQDRLVGYFSLYYHGQDIWVVALVQLAQAYKGQGLGTFFYDYAVMNDKLKIMSDATNTDGVHGSRNLWQSLKKKSRYQIVGYDTDKEEILPEVDSDQVYNNQANIRWLAIPGDKTINESIQYQQSLTSKRHIVWYGPGTTTEDYYNF
jgi:hypothetical protein